MLQYHFVNQVNDPFNIFPANVSRKHAFDKKTL